jgi:hypothetical protein
MPAKVTPRTFQAPQGDASDGLDKPAPIILVVDDDADVRGSIADLLQERGYRVVQASDGKQAFDYLSETFQPRAAADAHRRAHPAAPGSAWRGMIPSGPTITSANRLVREPPAREQSG